MHEVSGGGTKNPTRGSPKGYLKKGVVKFVLSKNVIENIPGNFWRQLAAAFKMFLEVAVVDV
jgi:hypothetical protein